MSTDAITEADIRMVVERFYGEVRVDQILNGAFAAITEWDDHLERMTAFWSSMMLSTGRYKGNPVAMHLIHLEHIRPEMFERWLALWEKVTSDALGPEVATEIQQRAARIAARLSAALFDAERPDFKTLQPQISSQPYRSTAVFNEDTIPGPLLKCHQLRPRTWVKLSVIEGSLVYHREAQPAISAGADTTITIPPDVTHHLQIVGPVKCQLHFYDHQPSPL
ncbi:DUF1971 domain-containing protein [Ensifer sp. ENS12]|uniref:DUF1971 domain-containing protein n=1 Tax=Ensifer sp. ENS12 TaxID=2854774 RepID=UPI0013B00288|nr:DUF1971 domain-containing protein [Ensifer sp. ENS12]MBV7518836.1 DUF1971 domain-containing protein [Ensifer sp. ENS12]